MNIYNLFSPDSYCSGMGVTGLSIDGFSFYLKSFFSCHNKPMLIVCSNMYEANKMYQSLALHFPCSIFPSDDFVFTDDVLSSPELKTERMSLLFSLLENNKQIVFTDLNGFLKYLPTPVEYKNNLVTLKVGDLIDPNNLEKKLYDLGYQKDTIVSKTGDIASRGFVLDIFGAGENNAFRIEFFGDEIESIRYFDVDTQKSLEEVASIKIVPFKEQFDYRGHLLDYMKDAIVIYKDYEQIKLSYDRLLQEFINEKDKFYDLFSINVKEYFYYFDFDSDYSLANKLYSFDTKEVVSFSENLDIMRKTFLNLLEEKKTVVLCLTKSIFNFLEELDIPYVKSSYDNIILEKLNVIYEPILSGFAFNDIYFFSEFELFHKKVSVNRKQKFKFSSKIADLSKIEIGDFVVHNTHGIGIYNGIKTICKKNLLNDYLEILYDKGDKLYIPVDKIYLIGKYTGKDGYVPKINALNSTQWLKTKQKVREKVRYEASRLLRVQAERELKEGFSFSKDSEYQILFEQEFPYSETADQLKVIDEIKKDMESNKPMDRILCGDVGYGKTEVAFRAIFKAVMDSKQVLYLCPTTLLCKQQYEAALSRFKHYPVRFGILNRFTTPKETEVLLEQLSNGEIDVVFGTHRLFSKDVCPKNLGLLIIDEEQRFGVAHKEKLKEYKSNIDVLTLTATPIPRTLQMAMVGLRNLSLIETAPLNRHSVQTYVLSYDIKRIRDIIYKEISRNGQVFILYNSVTDIEKKMFEFSKLVPDAKFIYAHGQMNKNELEDRMERFINHEYDVLICTTIIETGIDIPNANSLIILDADRFGLAQLYQIRGRIGRSDRIAYAYLMYDPKKVLTETAVKRLKVIKDYTELGSGFKIAARDLSIRGAGDILGSEQAGFIDSVGIDLYMKMLEEEMLKMKGEKPIIEDDDDSLIEVSLVSNHIKNSYISDESLKVSIHRLIHSINSYDSLEMVYNEIKDRFGKPDDDLILYMQEQLFEHFCSLLKVDSINDLPLSLEIVLSIDSSEKIDFENFFIQSVEIGRMFSFRYLNERLHIKILKNGLQKHALFYMNMLLSKMLN